MARRRCHDRAVGRIDVLVNDAAMMTFKPVLELDVSDFDRALAVNLRSVFLFWKFAGAGTCRLDRPLWTSVRFTAHETTPRVAPIRRVQGRNGSVHAVAGDRVGAAKSRRLCCPRRGRYADAVEQPDGEGRPREREGRGGRAGRHRRGHCVSCVRRSEVRQRHDVVAAVRLDVLGPPRTEGTCLNAADNARASHAAHGSCSPPASRTAIRRSAARRAQTRVDEMEKCGHYDALAG